VFVLTSLSQGGRAGPAARHRADHVGPVL